MDASLILSLGAGAREYGERLRNHFSTYFEPLAIRGADPLPRARLLLLILGPDWRVAGEIGETLREAVLNSASILTVLLDGAKLDTEPLPDAMTRLEGLFRLSVDSAKWDDAVRDIGHALERVLLDEPGQVRRGRRPSPAAPAPPSASAQLDQGRSVESASPAPFAKTAAAPEPVMLGASAPRSVRPGEEFTARFVAYVPEREQEVKVLLTELSPRSEPRLGIQACRWKPGTQVTVRLAARGLLVAPGEQNFVWEGGYRLVDFDVEVPEDAAQGTLVLKFDALVDGFLVARLRLDLEIKRDVAASEQQTVRGLAARTAFASYSSQDRQRVLDRIAAVRISAGLDVFLDCLSLRPGEQWKPELERQIRERDLFMLFWSKGAAESPWVSWEWQTALRDRGEEAMQIHALEVGVAPPEQLKHLHFGDVLMMIRAASEPPMSRP